MKSILDRSFRYTPSFGTDLKKTLAKVRRDQQLEADQAKRSMPIGPAKISSIVGRAAGGTK